MAIDHVRNRSTAGIAGRLARVLIGAAVLLVVLPMSAAQAAPIVTLSPTSAAPGASVTVSGSGFQGKTSGTVLFGGTAVASFRTNPKGTFSSSFVVPATASGDVTVTATAGTLSASAVLRVTTPPPVVQPSYFATLPPGSTLRSDSQCASWVRRSAWEPRPQNYTANNTRPGSFYLPGFTPSDGGVDIRSRAYADRVTGNFTGTTDEIIQWASCKWGFDEDISRAVAVKESNWIQASGGDLTYDASLCQAGYTVTCPQSFGLMQIKATTNKGTYPHSLNSTAFNVDYVLMMRRICYEGWVDWLHQWYPYSGGDEWGCVGFHYSGAWKDAGANAYVTSVQGILASRTWAQPGF